MKNSYDAIIIGAGINGLVTAAYLAKAGRRVLVLEKRDVIGGTTVTEEAITGFKFDSVAHSLVGLSAGIVRDLDLGRHGLVIEEADPAVFTPLPDGGGLTMWRDPAKTVEEIRRFSKAGAEKWPAFCKQMSKLTRFIGALHSTTPPRITETSPGTLLTLAKLGLHLKGMGDKDMVEAIRTLPMPIAELLDDWFESDVLKGTLGAAGITGLMQGPRGGGTAYAFLHHNVGNAAGVFRSSRFARGGMGKLAESIASAAKARGAEIRTGTVVSRVTVRDGRAVGVAASTGEEFGAAVVASAADPKRTFFDLLDVASLDPQFIRQIKNIRFRGAVAKVNLALGEAPKFASGAQLISISPSLDYLERAYDDAKYGDVSRQPYLEAVVSSAANGKCAMSVWAQYVPYQVKGKSGKLKELVEVRVMEVLREYAPKIDSAIEGMQVITPQDLETDYGLSEGAIYHGELALDQFFFMRPAPGWAQYRTPVEGLYLCGAGAHPGGGAMGAAGRNAAREILGRR